mmetsp:Transcript_46314/g.133395  ORF Transcript_46314/g.133395 Transcript_46314/m.133395 type:complete len:223 (-) Transcript_46314:509-1177(-)
MWCVYEVLDVAVLHEPLDGLIQLPVQVVDLPDEAPSDVVQHQGLGDIAALGLDMDDATDGAPDEDRLDRQTQHVLEQQAAPQAEATIHKVHRRALHRRIEMPLDLHGAARREHLKLLGGDRQWVLVDLPGEHGDDLCEDPRLREGQTPPHESREDHQRERPRHCAQHRQKAEDILRNAYGNDREVLEVAEVGGDDCAHVRDLPAMPEKWHGQGDQRPINLGA